MVVWGGGQADECVGSHVRLKKKSSLVSPIRNKIVINGFGFLFLLRQEHTTYPRVRDASLTSSICMILLHDHLSQLEAPYVFQAALTLTYHGCDWLSTGVALIIITANEYSPWFFRCGVSERPPRWSSSETSFPSNGITWWKPQTGNTETWNWRMTQGGQYLNACSYNQVCPSIGQRKMYSIFGKR